MRGVNALREAIQVASKSTKTEAVEASGETGPVVGARRVSGLWRVALAMPLAFGVGAMACLGWVVHRVVPGTSEGWFASVGVPVSDREGLLGALLVATAVMAGGAALVLMRLHVMLRIRSALHAFGGGERSLGVLRVADRRGAARAWNTLLEWRGDEAAEALSRAMLRPSAGGGGGTGDRAADAMWQGVVLVDEQQVIRYANGAAAVLLRQRRETLPGTDVRRVITDERVLATVREAISTGSRQRRVTDVGDPSSEDSSVLRYSVRAMGGRGERSVLVVVEDVTQQRVSDAAQHAFVAQATHELRTPLTNMRLYVEQLIDDDLTPEERGRALNVVNGEISRLDRIVGDMLSIAEIQAGNLHAKSGEVRVQPLFEQLQNDYAEAARQKNLKLEFDLPPKFPAVMGDREKISIVLHNLLGNAVKYTPEGGSVRVSVHEEGDRLVTEVSDTGIGIGESDQQRIFERFVRAKDDRVAATTGTGLGLALARDIARLHGGDVTVQSERDKGSVFSFWLPINVDTRARAA
jgi:signal transduction histidine kinase